MATREELQEIADQEIEDAKPLHKSIDGERVEFTDEDYEVAKRDLGNSKWDEQQFGYISARQSAYGSIEEQLDMIYWDKINDTTVWEDHITKVKTDNPKPE
ncbi:MAG: hypothetical protein Unbinned6224contig1003_2 [Prokaryotic dsDNA virus sp.]|nr:MAG: hypothetical protein Unbinned6224contig1003_2 [Prokaryotic dsDNA virus sp.]